MSRKSILLIVEGAKQEKALFRALLACYRLDLEYEIYSYGTNIYELYEKMFSDGMQDELSLLGVLKERAAAGDRWLFDQDYSDILLVFDYDPQDDRFSPERLETMQDYFNESTDNGKLYVNYPMVEACKHFLKMPDAEFINRMAALDDVSRYKQIVGNASRYQSFERDFKKPDIDMLIAKTAAKAQLLSGHEPRSEHEHCCNDIDHAAILRIQNETLRSCQKIWVLGTCLLFIPDYSTELVDFQQE